MLQLLKSHSRTSRQCSRRRGESSTRG